MKKEKFEFGIFILDCIMCFGLMVVSVIFAIPSGIIVAILTDALHTRRFGSFLDSFYGYSTMLTLCHTFMFALYFFLEKKNIIQYRIYKPSFWFVFVSINGFWWFLAYLLNLSFK